MYQLSKVSVKDDNLNDIECGYLICDETSTIRLNNVLKDSGNYVFQGKFKSTTSKIVNVSITSSECDLSLSSSWQKFIYKFNNIDATTRKYMEITFPAGEYWFYNLKLETGSIPSAWSESSTDIDNKIYTAYTQLKQRADGMEVIVGQKQDTGLSSIRYIRDWLNGNNIDNKNYWCECRVINTDSGNIVENGTVSLVGRNSTSEEITITNIDKFTDGVLSTSGQYIESEYATCTGEACIEIDLGLIHTDIDYIQIWHRNVNNLSDDKFIFNHKLQVSSDATTWVTLYDSSVAGGYSEEENGRTYYVSSSSISKNINNLTIGLTETQSKITSLDGQVTTLNQSLESISATVGANKDEADSKIESLKNYFDEQGEQIKKDAMADFRVEADGIYATASSVDDMNTELRSYMQQDSTSWKMLFAQLGMGEEEDKLKVQTNIEMNVNGLTVTNPNTGQQTLMTIDQFAGLYNGEKVFWIDKDTTKTRRLLCEKGWDTDYIKMTTNAYRYSDGTILRGVAYVKSGGSS